MSNTPSKSITIPILNHEYKVVVCWGDLIHLKKTLTEHHYNPDNITKTFLEEQADKRRGVTFREHLCYPTIWIGANLPASEAIGTLAHEAVHAVDFIFEALDENMYHSEIFAHSVGAIVRNTLESMKLTAKLKEQSNE